MPEEKVKAKRVCNGSMNSWSFECMIGACLVDTFKAWLIENQVVGQ